MRLIQHSPIVPAVVLGFLTVLGATAQADPGGSQPYASGNLPPAEVAVPSGPSSFVTGTVVNSSRDELVVRNTDGLTHHFLRAPDRPYGAAMIPGDRVRVEYVALDDGGDVAKNVQTLDLLAVISDEVPEEYASGGAEESQGGAMPEQDGAATDVADASEQMPATASPLPYALLAGTLLLGAGVGVRLLGRG